MADGDFCIGVDRFLQREDDDGDHGQSVPRTCADCGRVFWMGRHEPYLIHVVCDRCQVRHEQMNHEEDEAS